MCVKKITKGYLKIRKGGVAFKHHFWKDPGNNGAPEKSRTPNLQIRSLTLYPIELRARIEDE